jgi:predicted AlkP superfamily pyrophosphatase or phosphodiesterase
MPPTEYSLTALAPTIAALLGLPAPARAQEAPLAEVLTDLAPAERVAVLAPDALGWYPFSRWRAEMPFLSSLHDQRSLVLRAVMPTITPVNFATMVSGTDLPGHGIQAFTSDFQCETLFDVVRAHGAQSAGIGQMGWTGSELLGRYADLWGKAESNTDEEVEALALGFARSERPQFLITQIGNTDLVFHKLGPTSPEVVPALHEMDARLQRMVGELRALGYVVIVTADHGQHDCTDGGGGTHGSPEDEDALVPCTWVG